MQCRLSSVSCTGCSWARLKILKRQGGSRAFAKTLDHNTYLRIRLGSLVHGLEELSARAQRRHNATKLAQGKQRRRLTQAECGTLFEEAPGSRT